MIAGHRSGSPLSITIRNVRPVARPRHGLWLPGGGLLDERSVLRLGSNRIDAGSTIRNRGWQHHANLSLHGLELPADHELYRTWSACLEPLSCLVNATLSSHRTNQRQKPSQLPYCRWASCPLIPLPVVEGLLADARDRLQLAPGHSQRASHLIGLVEVRPNSCL